MLATIRVSTVPEHQLMFLASGVAGIASVNKLSLGCYGGRSVVLNVT